MGGNAATETKHVFLSISCLLLSGGEAYVKAKKFGILPASVIKRPIQEHLANTWKSIAWPA